MTYSRERKPNPLAVMGISRDMLVLVSSANKDKNKTNVQNLIRSVYRALSTASHPDQGGDETRFNSIAQAYEQLQDGKVLAAAYNDLMNRKVDASTQLQQALQQTASIEEEWAAMLVDFALAHAKPVKGRCLVHRTSEKRSDIVADHPGFERNQLLGVHYDVTIDGLELVADEVIAEEIARGGPRSLDRDFPVLHQDFWYFLEIDPDRRAGSRYRLNPNENQRKLVFLGTSGMFRPSDMFTQPAEAMASIGGADGELLDNIYAADYPPRMVLPLLRSLSPDLSGITLVGAYYDGADMKIVILGSIVSKPDEKAPKLIP